MKKRCNVCKNDFITNDKKSKYCSMGCYHSTRRRYKKVCKKGYVYVKVDGHPNADIYGFVREHRYIIEQHIGRYLDKGEVVHHINGNKNDNRIENLQVMTISEHSKLECSKPHIGYKKGNTVFRTASQSRKMVETKRNKGSLNHSKISIIKMIIKQAISRKAGITKNFLFT